MKYSLTRIAPTPSGFPHLGNAFSFLLTQALAERHGAEILLRIDDLDRERYRKEYVQDIFDTLDFLEIKIDLGPKSVKDFESEWSQVHRMNFYLETFEMIRNSGSVFSCDCSRSKIHQMDARGFYLGYCLDRKIPLDRKETSWRVNTLESDFLSFTEYPNQKIISLIPEETAFYPVKKKDLLPSYHLTSLVDDLHFGVDLIVRGKDLYPSTIAQLDMARILEKPKFGDSTFFHHELLKGPNQVKLSKSAGDTSVQFLRKEGKKLSDIIELLGKLLGKEGEIRSKKDLLQVLP